MHQNQRSHYKWVTNAKKSLPSGGTRHSYVREGKEFYLHGWGGGMSRKNNIYTTDDKQFLKLFSTGIGSASCGIEER